MEVVYGSLSELISCDFFCIPACDSRCELSVAALAAISLCHHNELQLYGTVNPNKSFPLYVTLAMVLRHSNKKVTNIYYWREK